MQVGSDFVLAGYTGFAGGKMLLSKTDGNGNIIWNKTYGAASNLDNMAYSVTKTVDGNYLLSASTDVGMFNFRPYLIKINGDGAVLWEKMYGNTNGRGASVVLCSDGELDKQIHLLRTDSSGNVLQEKNYGNKDDAAAYTMMVSNEKSYDCWKRV